LICVSRNDMVATIGNGGADSNIYIDIFKIFKLYITYSWKDGVVIMAPGMA